MNTANPLPAFAGRSFHVEYPGLAAHNIYSADARRVRYAIVSGPYAGASGEAECQWQQIAEGVYVISWQEADGATVVHVEDFANGHSQAFFTASDLSFYRMQGPLTELGAQEQAR
ncbi:hypothetical protein D3C80_1816840 [compost metagenome]